MFRTAYTKLKPEYVRKKLAPAPAPAQAGSAPKLAGTALSIVTDKGPKLNYRFKKGKLQLSVDGGAPVETAYGAAELRGLLLVSCLVPDTGTSYHLVLDRKTGLATVFEVWFADPDFEARESRREIYFGYAAGKGEALLPDNAIIALRLRHDEVVRVRELRRGHNLLVRRVRRAVADVLLNRVVEEQRLLHYGPY